MERAQPGFTGTPIIEIDGTFAGQEVSGLQLTTDATGSTIEGLDITGFSSRDGIDIDASGVQVVGNYLGFNTAGNAAANEYGVFLAASGNTVGGTTVASRNVISGNSIDGVGVSGSSNVIEGNYIGTDPSGTIALPNSAGGVSLDDASGNTVGGTTTGAANIISENVGDGVTVASDGTAPASGNVIEGNEISGNADTGITIGNASGNTVGGTTAGAANVVSGNMGDGVMVSSYGTRARVG